MGTGGATITWYGHACVEVRTPGGKTILFDPWFGNPKSPKSAADVRTCDLLLVTHGHSDHFGDALALASRLRPTWPVIHEMSLWLARRLPGGGDAVVGMNKGGTFAFGEIAVTMVGADHSAGDWNAGAETTLYLGEPAGFVVRLEDGTTVYHAGDTNVFSDMALIRELYRPSLALLPIGGHFTMGPREAALAAELLGVEAVAPIHWGTFPILAGTPAELRHELDERGLRGTVVHGWAPGDSITA
jgi:L-ascorbate metabolism protein UlaG (beta-lactamase superfamily)